MSHHQACWVRSSLFSDAKDRSSLALYYQEEQPGHGFLLLMRILSPFLPDTALQGQTLLVKSVKRRHCVYLHRYLVSLAGLPVNTKAVV